MVGDDGLRCMLDRWMNGWFALEISERGYWRLLGTLVLVGKGLLADGYCPSSQLEEMGGGKLFPRIGKSREPKVVPKARLGEKSRKI